MPVAKCLGRESASEQLAACRAKRGVGAGRPVDVRALRGAESCLRSAMTWHLSAGCCGGSRRQGLRRWRFGSGVFHRLQRQCRTSGLPTTKQAQAVGVSPGSKLGKVGGIIAFGAGSWCQAVRPNTSFKRTRNGMAPGPRGRLVYHRPRGPGSMPLRAA